MKKIKSNLKKFSYIYQLFNILLASLKKIRKKNYEKASNIMILIGNIAKGGAERAVVNLAEKLSEKHNVIIVTYYNGKLMKNVELYDVDVKHIHIKEEDYKIKRIKELKRKNKITHCISFSTRSNYLNTITRVNEKVIISIRNYMSIAENNRKLRIENKIASKLCDCIVAVSEDVKNDYINTYKVKPDKISTIYNYCNKEYIEESIQKYNIDENDKTIFENGRIILTVGKLKQQKGTWHLIRAFKKVAEKNKNAKLVILGIGELEEYLKKLIKEMNLEDRVYLLGHKNKNIYTYMKKSDIFVLPSLFEGMPNAILEAMQCGLPIIATDCYGGNKEIIEPNYKNEIKQITKCEYGILVPKLDFNYYNANDELTKEEIYLADAINEMLENNELLEFYKKKSYERVNDFNKESYVKKWEEIL